MSVYPVVVKLPEGVFERVKRTAKGLKQPIQQTMVKIVEAGLPSLAKVPPEYQSELEALEAMSDEELEKMAQDEMSAAQQRQLEHLLRKNQAEGLNEIEQQSLEQLHAEANRLMLQKSYVHVLLKWRALVMGSARVVAA
jgi:uncharacterized protein YcbK (DUF882 family)